MKTLNTESIRKQFPLIYNKADELIYFDSAATMQKSQAVINRIKTFYEGENANVNRGIYSLSEKASAMYEDARITVQKFIGAKHAHEIVFTKGATESINFIVQAFLANNLLENDEVIISEMEHHSNIVPWQILCEKHKAHLRIIPVNEAGELELESLELLISKRTKLIAITHVSNVLGTINPVEEIIDIAHQHNIPILLDGAQAAPHVSIDVSQLNCDFYVFSSHKIGGPLGAGVLYINEKWHDQVEPYQFGGDMIETVSFDKTTFRKSPQKFEAGTPNIVGAIGLAEAINFIQKTGADLIHQHERSLADYFLEKSQAIDSLKFLAKPSKHVPLFSFNLGNIHPHDLSSCLAEKGIAVRAGHHCAMPLLKRFKVPAVVRVSLAFYNTKAEIDHFFKTLTQIKDFFSQHDI